MGDVIPIDLAVVQEFLRDGGVESVYRTDLSHKGLFVGRCCINVRDGVAWVFFGHHGSIDFDLRDPDNSGLEDLLEFVRK